MRNLRRLLGLGTRILASNFRRSPLPFKLTFIVTYRCDCRCQMCNIWKRKVEDEMANFSPNFDNPDEFLSHIRLMGELVIRDLSRLTPYVELIRDGRIYHTLTPLKVR